MDYNSFLNRPDHKQEFVAEWQEEFNEVAEDMRADPDTKVKNTQA